MGHAYTTIVADVMRRFYDLMKYDTFFITGTDEHGDKIARAAQAKGMSPQKYVDQISLKFRELLPRINASNDRFIRTTDPNHEAVVRQILQKVYDNGDIYFSEYEGLYCYGCERFYGEDELVDGKCPDHQTEPEQIKESNYFFRMSKYQQWLIDYIDENPDFIRPERYKNEVLGSLRDPIDDLCISRPKSRLEWGIELPFDTDYVTYVWFDALLNYLSVIEYPDSELYEKFWPVAQHFIGKDILRQHGVYWPTMLKAAGIPQFAHLNVHGYWVTDEGKMSKSRGNVIKPLDLIEKYGLDPFRYYLIRDMSFGLDSVFSEEGFVNRYNADLANDLGNMVSRLTKMIKSNCNGVVPIPGELTEAEARLNDIADETRQSLITNFDKLMMHQATEAVNHLVRSINRYLEETAPWTMAKQGDSERLNTILFTAAQNTVRAALFLSPIMPEKMQEVFTWFGIEIADDLWIEDELLKAGFPVQIAKKPIFPRLKFELSEEQPTPSPKQKDKKVDKTDAAKSSETEKLSYDDFIKLDLRIATILEAERVEGTDKLMKLQIEVGEEKRQIIAGIAEYYQAEDLPGKQIVVVANLKPAKIRGVVSNGMLLAANADENLVLVTPEKPIASGIRVK